MKKWGPPVGGVCAFLISLWYLPAFFFSFPSDIWLTPRHHDQLKLARQVAFEVGGGLDRSAFRTGSARFDGEWLFGTYMMAGVGLCQMAQAFPEHKNDWQSAIQTCIRELQSDTVTAFDTEAWGRNALDSLDDDFGHAAYLGYFNLLLGLYENVYHDDSFSDLHQRISRTLFQCLQRSSNHLVATYPGEWYPVDNAAVGSSLFIWAARPGMDKEARVMQSWMKEFSSAYCDPDTGLLFQTANLQGHPIDAPRGSGTTLACFLFAHGNPDFSRKLFRATREHLFASVLNFGAVREYPNGHIGRGDIDSGPIFFDRGFSATGFALSGAKMFGSAAEFRSLYASARFAGIPVDHQQTRRYLTAGPLGNAILLVRLQISFFRFLG